MIASTTDESALRQRRGSNALCGLRLTRVWSGRNTASTDRPNSSETRNARERRGSNFPLSIAMIVCRDTPSSLPRSA